MVQLVSLYGLRGVRGMRDPIIWGPDGNRIGINTICGPVLGLPPERMAEMEDTSQQIRREQIAELGARAKVSREVRMKTLRELSEVSPKLMIDRLDQLTFDERKLLQYALTMGDSVNLPWAVSNLIKTREHRDRSKHATEVALHRAARRLYNRGLGTVEKRDDGLIWFSVSRERLLSAIRTDIEKRRPPASEQINLSRGHCFLPIIIGSRIWAVYCVLPSSGTSYFSSFHTRSGYYQYVQVYDTKTNRWRNPTEKEATRMAKEDRKLFTNGTNKPLTGKPAVRSVEKNWKKSHISRLKLHSKMAINTVEGSKPKEVRSAKGSRKESVGKLKQVTWGRTRKDQTSFYSKIGILGKRRR